MREQSYFNQLTTAVDGANTAAVRTAIDLAAMPVVRDWHVTQLRAKRLSPATQAFKQFLLEEAGGAGAVVGLGAGAAGSAAAPVSHAMRATVPRKVLY